MPNIKTVDSETNPTAEFVAEITTHEHASSMGREVETLFSECLFKDAELNDGTPRNGLVPVMAEGVRCTVGFHPERVASAKPKVIEFIKQMDESFLKSKGGGWSFLNLCNDRHGNQWANLHRTMEQLVQLAIACGLGGYCLPREIWNALPGGMPYVWLDVPTDSEGD